MTYQVLARKWRPKDFASLIGQAHVVRALTHALEQQRLHHAYLFTGTRGVGKTTLSRILAKALNCETGITATPCGVCNACRDIDAGRFVDYVEMDAASNRGVDEMAALLERAVYAPVDARFKVYMIDEVHMLTNHAFNAMLKTLEEPPAHVKFILATTDPQKIPVTVLSRCLQFNLKQMPASDIVAHLDMVLGAEGIASQPQALRLLARAADGSMRDALSLTDQAIAYAAGEVSEEAVRGMLGTLDQSYLIRLLDAIAQQDGSTVLAVADEMALRSLSFSTALQELAGLLHRIAWAQFAPGSVLDEWPDALDIRRFAAELTPEHVQLYYQIATLGRAELGLAPDEYAGFSMTLLRMLAFQPAAGGVVAPPGSASAPASRAVTAVAIPAAPPVAPLAVTSPDGGRPARVAERPVPAAEVAPPAPSSPARQALDALRGAGLKMSPRAPGAARPVPATTRPGASPAATSGASAARGADQEHGASQKHGANQEHRATPKRDGGETRVDVPPWDELPPLDEAPDGYYSAMASSDAFESSLTEPAGHVADETLAEPPAHGATQAAQAAQAASAAALALAPAISLAPLGFDGDWPALAITLALKGIAYQLAFNSELQALDGATLQLRVAVPQYAEAAQVAKLKAALIERLGQPVEVVVEVGPAARSAAVVAAAAQARRQQEAERAIEQDPFVQSLIREFDATIVPGSIRPLPGGAGQPAQA